MNLVPNLTDNIRNIIESRGFKHRAVAEKAGLKPKQFSDILNGRRGVDAVELWRIASALGVTPNDLFGIKHDNEKRA